jgi:amidase
VATAVTALAGCSTTGQSVAAAGPNGPIIDRSILEMRHELDTGQTSSVALVKAYLARIDAVDRHGPQLRSVLATNPDALRQAQQLDEELKQRGPRGPLHGIPILLKDNIESADPLPTTAGSLALAHNLTQRDAPIVANLRAAGAIILGKTNLSEWANFRSTHSISGWSGMGGLTKNPHVLDRSACGSSAGSGSATAAGLAAASVGTETDGSITCPSALNGVVGLKPTAGLLSGQYIVPIAHSQDTAGPMTRSVSDAAVMLAAMVGDPAACRQRAADCKITDYAAGLSTQSLRNKRIGVLHFAAGQWPAIEPIYAQALEKLRAAGATLIDVTLPDTSRVGAAERIVLDTEFKADLNAYLATTPATVTTRTLAQLIEFNAGSARETVLFGQEIFTRANATAGVDDPAYKTALADSKRLAGPEGLLALLKGQQLDFLVAPTTGTAWRIDSVNGDQSSGSFSSLPAVSGYPHLTVPMGSLHDLPLGMSFIGAPWSEGLLLSAGYAFEQLGKGRVIPAFRESVETHVPGFDRPQ